MKQSLSNINMKRKLCCRGMSLQLGAICYPRMEWHKIVFYCVYPVSQNMQGSVRYVKGYHKLNTSKQTMVDSSVSANQ